MNLFEIDTKPIESAVESFVDVITETVTEEVVPAARKTARRTEKTVRRNPRITIGTVAAVAALLACIVWYRSRRTSAEAEITELERSAAA